MKKFERFKKYGMALLSFTFMISIAGYINYKYNPEREKDLGQTVYVSTNTDNVNIYEDETKDVNNSIEETISSFRYDRDKMYSELATNYNNIINNSNSSSDTISEYQSKLSQLIEEKNQINMVENVIKTKGIDDVVIIPTSSGKVNVIVKSESLDDSTVAKIMQIIIDQLGIAAKNISIEKIMM